MAGRKTKLTPERQEKILECVRLGMSNKAAAQVAGISEKTLYNWIECGEKDTSGPFFEFLKSSPGGHGTIRALELQNHSQECDRGDKDRSPNHQIQER